MFADRDQHPLPLTFLSWLKQISSFPFFLHVSPPPFFSKRVTLCLFSVSFWYSISAWYALASLSSSSLPNRFFRYPSPAPPNALSGKAAPSLFPPGHACWQRSIFFFFSASNPPSFGVLMNISPLVAVSAPSRLLRSPSDVRVLF